MFDVPVVYWACGLCCSLTHGHSSICVIPLTWVHQSLTVRIIAVPVSAGPVHFSHSFHVCNGSYSIQWLWITVALNINPNWPRTRCNVSERHVKAATQSSALALIKFKDLENPLFPLSCSYKCWSQQHSHTSNTIALHSQVSPDSLTLFFLLFHIY